MRWPKLYVLGAASKQAVRLTQFDSNFVSQKAVTYAVCLQEDLDKVHKGHNGNGNGNKRSHRRPMPSQQYINQDTGGTLSSQ